MGDDGTSGRRLKLSRSKYRPGVGGAGGEVIRGSIS